MCFGLPLGRTGRNINDRPNPLKDALLIPNGMATQDSNSRDGLIKREEIGVSLTVCRLDLDKASRKLGMSVDRWGRVKDKHSSGSEPTVPNPNYQAFPQACSRSRG